MLEILAFVLVVSLIALAITALRKRGPTEGGDRMLAEMQPFSPIPPLPPPPLPEGLEGGEDDEPADGEAGEIPPELQEEEPGENAPKA